MCIKPCISINVCIIGMTKNVLMDKGGEFFHDNMLLRMLREVSEDVLLYIYIYIYVLLCVYICG